eukprot:TRINITY_DN10779_c0_g1_i8.p1 TRINITY_DN10779_c0_g1~~TRINITY_DN10779_c0_g1_i8.p1  ORF type:complete len:446 (-),score=56.54 TRINITY_DN10779_c0_g1_i8:569-1825(-)
MQAGQQSKNPSQHEADQTQSTNYLFVNVIGNEVEYVGPGENDTQAQTIIADQPVPQNTPIYYFEVEIVEKGQDGYIGVGLQQKQTNVFRLPGWEKNSYGYHGDDGSIFSGAGQGRAYGPKFTMGDVIGVLFNQLDKSISFTKNGAEIGTAFKQVHQNNLYPCIGLRTRYEKVRINFGDRPFVADFNAISERLKQQALKQLMNMKSVPQIRPVADKDELVVQLLEAKMKSGKSFDQIAKECGLTNVYTAQLFYNQAQLNQNTVEKLKKAVPQLTDELIEEMKMAPNRYYDDDILKEPQIHRLHEAISHNGQSLKALVNEKFGDGVMSTEDFFMTVGQTKGISGEDRVVITMNGKFMPFSLQQSQSCINFPIFTAQNGPQFNEFYSNLCGFGQMHRTRNSRKCQLKKERDHKSLGDENLN